MSTPVKCCTECRNINADSNLYQVENIVLQLTLWKPCVNRFILHQASFSVVTCILHLHLRFRHLRENARVSEISACAKDPQGVKINLEPSTMAGLIACGALVC